MTADAPIVAHDPVRRVLWARGLRDFGHGLAAVLLPAHLVALGYGAAEVGAVFAAGYQELPLVACGALKILYDLALLAAFRHIKPPEER